MVAFMSAFFVTCVVLVFIARRAFFVAAVCVWRFLVLPLARTNTRFARLGRRYRGGDVSRGRISPASRRNLVFVTRVSRGFGRQWRGGGGLEDEDGKDAGAMRAKASGPRT